jgi:hypothetical protein
MVELRVMRLVLACIVLFLVPAGCLFVTDRQVTSIEQDFYDDAARQITRLNRIAEMNPSRLRTMRNVAAIAQLKAMGEGAEIARQVCGPIDSPYRRLFDQLTIRCGRFDLLRRARWSALLAVMGTFVVLAMVLIARITVTRYDRRKEWPGNWALWFVMRGIQAMLAAQVAVSLIGFGILLQPVVARTLLLAGMLAVPFVLLYLLERRLVLAFVEPQRLRAYRVRGVQGPRRRMAPA